MFWNKGKIIFLKSKSGKIILGNGTSAKVLGKDNVDVDIKNTEVVNVRLVNGLKDNILSVSQIANKGNVIIFTSTRCKIIKEDTRKTIAKGFRNSDNLYVLKKYLVRNKRSSSSSSDS